MGGAGGCSSLGCPGQMGGTGGSQVFAGAVARRRSGSPDFIDYWREPNDAVSASWGAIWCMGFETISSCRCS